MLKEFEIINTYFTKLATNDYALGLTDDCAFIADSKTLVISTDTLIENGHFFSKDEPESIATKVLAVNLSDTAAMGAIPKYWLLNLSINQHFANPNWLKRFSEKLLELQSIYNISLIGGDTTFTKGPMVISVTLLGEIANNKVLKKTTALANQVIYVSNNIGDAHFGYKILYDKYNLQQNLYKELTIKQKDYLVSQYKYPTPQITLGQILIKYASSCTDVSDGLVADLEKLCQLSGVSGIIYLQSIYENIFSDSLKTILKKSNNIQEIIIQAITGGDDYQLVFCIPKNKAQMLETEVAKAGIRIHKIGETTVKKQLPLYITDLLGNNLPMNFNKGFTHSF
ncbi:Thiamine-monophosphate kinase [Candidatus Hepatincola sp. Av]